MELAAKLLGSFDFLPNHDLYVWTPLRVRLSVVDDTHRRSPPLTGPNLRNLLRLTASSANG